MGFSFTKILSHEAQRSYAYSALNDKTEREHARNSFGLLPQGFCERKTHKY